MLNVILPMAGQSSLSSELEYPYPSALVEINGIPLIQHVIDNLRLLDPDVNFTVILRDEDCRKFHLDSTVQLLTSHRANILRLKQNTAGALCSILLGIEYFVSDQPLVIANADQIFSGDSLVGFLEIVRELNPDAACPVFDSVHPRWSYVRIAEDKIVEAVEKNPVSRNAVAGLYYFREGRRFADMAMRAILNGRHTDDKYYTSAVLNEYILEGCNVLPCLIKAEDYHSLFTGQRVNDYERYLRLATSRPN